MGLFRAAKPDPSIAHDRAVKQAIPVPVDIAGQWAWRMLAIAAVLGLLFWLISELREIVVPFFVALLISALLVPLVNSLRRHGWPHWLAIVVALVGAAVIIGGLVFLVVWQVRAGLPNLEKESVRAYDSFRDLLRAPPFSVTNRDFNAYIGTVLDTVQKNSSAIAKGALSIGTTGIHLLTGTLLTLFATIFLLIDGRGVWGWVVRLFPRRARGALDGAGQAGWMTLSTFVRVQVFVATVNAVGVGLFAFFLGVPLAIPIAVVVFLASFIPVVGAVATGIIAVAVALVYVGPLQALIMLGGVLIVHLLESQVLQPLVMGGAVKVHPLAVVLAVAAGSFVAGIPGALFAVPIVAVLGAMVVFVARGSWRAAGTRAAGNDAAAVDAAETVTPRT